MINRRSAMLAFPLIASPWSVRAQGVDVVQFGADPSGKKDSSQAINRALAQGGHIVIPSGARFKVEQPLKAEVAGSRLSGGGLIFSTEALKQEVLLTLSADGVVVDGVRFANPSEAQAPRGGRNVAVGIFANGCQVLRSGFDRFQHSIMVSAHGEFFDTLIAQNVLTNCIGAGGGPRNLISSLGEDRGDGIVSWGARTTIVSNSVTAKPGTDARIGIHCEALAKYKELAPTPEDDSVALIADNMVRGPFRRGIVVEGVSRAVVRRNRLPGGYTWWAIAALQGASDIQIIENDVVFDRRQNDHSGFRWNPLHAAIMCAVYGPNNSGARQLVRANNVTVTHGGGAGIFCLNSGKPGALAEQQILDNIINAVEPAAYPGIGARDVTRLRVSANTVRGHFQRKVQARGVTDIDLRSQPV